MILVVSVVFYSENNKNKSVIATKTGDENPKKIEENILAFPEKLPNPAQEIKVPILMYHYVEDGIPNSKLRADLQVQTKNFKEQMDFLKSNGYETIKMEDLFMAMYYKKPLPPKPVIITFDDGYSDAYQIALPILKEKGMTGTFFIITGFFNKIDYLSQDNVIELANQGMEIGSHTQMHSDLSIVSQDKSQKEIFDSKKDLENLLGKKIYFFCFPSGKYNAETLEIVKTAGYLMAVSTKEGIVHSSNSPFETTRIRIRGEDSLDKFKESLSK